MSVSHPIAKYEIQSIYDSVEQVNFTLGSGV